MEPDWVSTLRETGYWSGEPDESRAEDILATFSYRFYEEGFDLEQNIKAATTDNNQAKSDHSGKAGKDH